MGFAGIGAALGQGFTSAILPQLQLRNQLRQIQRLAPQARQVSQQLQQGGALDPLAASLLGIQMPQPSLSDQIFRSINAANMLNAQFPGGMGFPQAPTPTQPTSLPTPRTPQTPGGVTTPPAAQPGFQNVTLDTLQQQGIKIPQNKVIGVDANGDVAAFDSEDEATQAGFNIVR